MGISFLPVYKPFVARRKMAQPSLQLFDPRHAIRKSVVDKGLFSSALKRMPVGSKLPLEYPVDRLCGRGWISDVSSRERVRRLSDNPNEFLVWAKRPAGWHLARSNPLLV